MTKNRFLDFCKNYIPSMTILLLVYWFYTHHAYFTRALNVSYIINIPDWYLNYSFKTFDVFLIIVALHAVILPFFYLLYPSIPSKARIFFGYIFRKKTTPLTSPEKVASLSILVKIFFIPLMINWLLGHTINVIQGGYDLITHLSFFSTNFLQFFNSFLFTLVLQSIFLVDVFFFTFGYLIEIPDLKNRIISVEPSLFGWIVCLMCYPPFNNITNGLVGWNSSDFPQFSSPVAHIFLNTLILILMGIYASASIALNWKASNLTNRGIITTGIYRFVRHPAYVAKNIAWWIGSIPVILASTSQGVNAFIFAILTPIIWSIIYTLRAITEERHLLLANNGYHEYMRQVKYRFIPGIW